MPDVIMPRLSDSMQEGTILRWLKQGGENVKRGEGLLEVETDKATMVYEADASGVLTITVNEGATVPVGATIGHLGPLDEVAPREAELTFGAKVGAGDRDADVSRGRATTGCSRTSSSLGASPMARRTAEKLGVDLSAVVGSGPRGRIVKADVVAAVQIAAVPSITEAALAEAQPAATETGLAAPTASRTEDRTEGELQLAELSRAQALIARRLSESRATVPEFALEVDLDATAVVDLRSQLKTLADPAPSLNDIIVKACGLVLRRHPRVNGSYNDGRFELHPRVNVGIAVAVKNALIVPTVFDADVKSLSAIAAETRQLVERGRAGRITPPELGGGTFTVSNLGMFGIDRFEAIISPPQAAILCIGAIRKRPWAINDHVVARSVLTLTLACDHRILYGAEAARFLNDLKGALTQPLATVL